MELKNKLESAVHRISASRTSTWVLSRLQHRIDLILLRVTGGRMAIPKLMVRSPIVELTTIGAKTGKKRTVPVGAIRDGEKWVLFATNWGKERHPAWYHNLKANPEVRLSHRTQTNEYVARDANPEEQEEYWSRVDELHAAFEIYRQRSGDREIPVVVLEPPETATEE